jgi:hypothetical protein
MCYRYHRVVVVIFKVSFHNFQLNFLLCFLLLGYARSERYPEWIFFKLPYKAYYNALKLFKKIVSKRHF